MNLYGKTFGLLLGLALIAALGWAAYLGFEIVVSLFAALDAQVAQVTAIGSVVVLAAAAIVASAVRKVGAKNRAAQIQEQKVAAYQLFVECWQDPAPHKLQGLDRLLALYGGAAVIKAHTVLRTIAREKGARHPDVASQLGNALREIRKDLGTDVQTRSPAATELQQLLLYAPAPSHAGTRERIA